TLAPEVVFGNAEEWDEVGALATTRVVKHGAGGFDVIRGDAVERCQARDASVVDTTGAGDALAAGFLVGGAGPAGGAAARGGAPGGARPGARLRTKGARRAPWSHWRRRWSRTGFRRATASPSGWKPSSRSERPAPSRRRSGCSTARSASA